MRTALKEGFILFVFDLVDWNLATGGAQAVIIGIKKEMGPCTGANPDGFTYDTECKIWSFKDTPKNREIFERLVATHLGEGS